MTQVKQRLGNAGNGVKHKCDRNMHRHPRRMTAEEIWLTTLDDKHIGLLSEYILHSWPSTRTEVHKEAQPHLSFRGEIAIIDRIVMKGRRIILTALQ